MTDKPTRERAAALLRKALEIDALRAEVERLKALRSSVFCSDCGHSLEFLGGDGLIERSGQCETCAGERDCDALREQVATLAAERDGAIAEAAALRRERDVARAEVQTLKHEAERQNFERKKDLDAAEKSVTVAKAMRDQRNDLVGTLQAIAKLVGLNGDEAWVALCEDPSNVLRARGAP